MTSSSSSCVDLGRALLFVVENLGLFGTVMDLRELEEAIEEAEGDDAGMLMREEEFKDIWKERISSAVGGVFGVAGFGAFEDEDVEWKWKGSGIVGVGGSAWFTLLERSSVTRA